MNTRWIIPMVSVLVAGAALATAARRGAENEAAPQALEIECVQASKCSPDGKTRFVVNLFRTTSGTPLLFQGLSATATSEDGFIQIQDTQRQIESLAGAQEVVLREGDWALQVMPRTSTWQEVTQKSDLELVLGTE